MDAGSATSCSMIDSVGTSATPCSLISAAVCSSICEPCSTHRTPAVTAALMPALLCACTVT